MTDPSLLVLLSETHGISKEQAWCPLVVAASLSGSLAYQCVAVSGHIPAVRLCETALPTPARKPQGA